MFDLIVALILVVSAIVGLARGAVRELVAVLAFIFAVVIAVAALRFTLPMTLNVIPLVWVAEAAAILIVFAAAFILLKVAGAGLTNAVKATPIVGSADRIIGLGFGLIRGLIVVGLFNLLLTAATSAERMPEWVTGARLYKVSAAAASLLKVIAPKGFAVAGKVGPALSKAVKGAARDSLQDNDSDAGYEAPTRKNAN